jgi:hypothetical protein
MHAARQASVLLVGKLHSQPARGILQLKGHYPVSRPDRNNKAITSRRHSLDRLSVASSAQGLAEGGDVHAQAYFLDHRVRPHRAQQIVLADQMPAVANESDEQIEGLGCQGDRFSTAQQQALPGR